MYGIYVGIKILPWTILTIATVGPSEDSVQWPTMTNTTLADHGCRRRKHPPSAPHEAFCFAPMCPLNRGRLAKQVDINLWGFGGVYMALKTLPCCPDASSP
jgi:hypothetical protein